MSVLVKGMEMPSNCAHCICASEDARYCAAANEYIPMLGKPDFCPLVALPDKHGKLVDADALEPDADYDDGDYWAYSVAQVCNAPTIVESEDSE